MLLEGKSRSQSKLKTRHAGREEPTSKRKGSASYCSVEPLKPSNIVYILSLRSVPHQMTILRFVNLAASFPSRGRAKADSSVISMVGRSLRLHTSVRRACTTKEPD